MEEFRGQQVVVDLRNSYVCLGTLAGFDDCYLELIDADLHDLRDAEATREIYVASALESGIKRNRRRVLLMRPEVVAISLLQDVVDE